MKTKDNKFIMLDGKEIKSEDGSSYFQLNPTVQEMSELHQKLIIFPNLFDGKHGHQRAEVILEKFSRATAITKHLQRRNDSLGGVVKEKSTGQLSDPLSAAIINPDKFLAKHKVNDNDFEDKNLEENKINVVYFPESKTNSVLVNVYIPLTANFSSENAKNPEQFLPKTPKFQITENAFSNSADKHIKDINKNHTISLFSETGTDDSMYQSGNETLAFLLDGFTRAMGIRLLSIVEGKESSLQKSLLSLHLFVPPMKNDKNAEKYDDFIQDWHTRLFREKNAGWAIPTQHTESVHAARMKLKKGIPSDWEEIKTATTPEFEIKAFSQSIKEDHKDSDPFQTLGLHIVWGIGQQKESPFFDLIKTSGIPPTRGQYKIKDKTLADHVGNILESLSKDATTENITYGCIAESIHNFWQAIHEIMPIELYSDKSKNIKDEHGKYVIYRSAGIYILNSICCQIISYKHFLAASKLKAASTPITVDEFKHILKSVEISDHNKARTASDSNSWHKAFDLPIWQTMVYAENYFKRVYNDLEREPNNPAFIKAKEEADSIKSFVKPDKSADKINGKYPEVRYVKGYINEQGNSYGIYSRLSKQLADATIKKMKDTHQTQ